MMNQKNIAARITARIEWYRVLRIMASERNSTHAVQSPPPWNDAQEDQNCPDDGQPVEPHIGPEVNEAVHIGEKVRHRQTEDDGNER
jgi:hypothetical protein